MSRPISNHVDSDLALAVKLQEEFDRETIGPIVGAHHGSSFTVPSSSSIWSDTDNASSSSASPSTSNWNLQNGTKFKQIAEAISKPLSVVDEQWELTDPNPDVRALFLEYNRTYFWGKLECVEVRWSPRMTLCAGLCCYEGRGGLCSIRLSLPLLKLRPRSDLVQTLLHEMIHAYLFVTDNNKDHDGHGPEFCKHMKRINDKSGSKITVYHSFHDEVDVYRQHWWRCDGPCQKRPPYFGIVRRAMNRAPSFRDTWWSQHQSTCGGKYTKIKEPDDYGKKGKRKAGMDIEGLAAKKPKSEGQDIRSLFSGNGNMVGTSRSQSERGIKQNGMTVLPGDTKSKSLPVIHNSNDSQSSAQASRGKETCPETKHSRRDSTDIVRQPKASDLKSLGNAIKVNNNLFPGKGFVLGACSSGEHTAQKDNVHVNRNNGDVHKTGRQTKDKLGIKHGWKGSCANQNGGKHCKSVPPQMTLDLNGRSNNAACQNRVLSPNNSRNNGTWQDSHKLTSRENIVAVRQRSTDHTGTAVARDRGVSQAMRGLAEDLYSEKPMASTSDTAMNNRGSSTAIFTQVKEQVNKSPAEQRSPSKTLTSIEKQSTLDNFFSTPAKKSTAGDPQRAVIRTGETDSAGSDYEDEIMEIFTPPSAKNVQHEVPKIPMCQCPVCNKEVKVSAINAHLDQCLG
ncbi:PREDICTED: uncharacterized protein LOC106805952 [Priapulus caudatus]|uniref:Protein with SprT-like domain at the N terminus n=1 Tax=Priapulus caudatus TaxID=37621 RepID=A0ABM1DTG2_PRICU|nr:PREDICTED: uncharacterized protein LOC106805952 [Priapulus caudatus]